MKHFSLIKQKTGIKKINLFKFRSNSLATFNLKKTLLLLFMGSSLFAFSQTEELLTREVKKLNIETISDVQSALAEKGMTENEAREMAKLYGINYDDYISKYILDTSSSIKTQETPKTDIRNTVSEINYKLDTTAKEAAPVIVKSSDKEYFGYEIFENNPFANKDYLIGNIDENYILGPGDEIRLYVWGSHSYQAQVKIDLNGNVILPDNGVFFASGYTFETLKERLRSYLGKSYSGLTSSPQTSFIDISLTQLRPVSITVLGESNTPGPHLINGFATVLNALYASGGIKTSGSLREIKVYRKNKHIKTVDLYDYIAKGAINEDVRLMNNDVIFIPTRLNEIKLEGAIKKSSIFELKNNEGLNELIDIAGGFNANAAIKNIQLNRIIPFDERSEDNIYHRFISSLNLLELRSLKKNYKLNDGDVITVNEILDRVLNEVSISGPVKRPGTYSINEFPDLYSLINVAADSLLPRVYMERIHLYRNNEDGTRNFHIFNLSKVLDKVENFQLQNDDEVVLFSLNDIKGDDRTVTINGFGSREGVYPWSDGLTLYDLVFENVSTEDKEFMATVLDSRIDLNRFNVNTGLFYKKSFSLISILENKENEFLLPRDQVSLYSKDVSEVIKKTVRINGYIKNPGEYALTENMVPGDLILLAGGFLENSDKSSVVITRPNFDIETGKISESFIIDLDLDFILGNKKDESTFILKHKDIVSVDMISGYEELKSVIVSGEIRKPGSISMNNKNESLNDILSKAGGITPYGSLKSSYIKRDGEIFIADLKKLLNDDIAFLKNNDEIILGSNSGTVSVKGAVMNEGLFVWKKNYRLKKYIKNAGSYDGKIEKAVVRYPNGITLNKSFFKNPKVLPNSEIFVYAKPKKEKNENEENFTDKFIQLLSVVTGSLTTIILARSLN